ncbi:MAG: T6SS immunity protein Tli4 family protein [Rhodocyclaceae bacterium]
MQRPERVIRVDSLLLATFLLAMSQLAACSEKPKAADKSDVNSICLDQFVLALSGEVDMGAANLIYQGAHSLPGFKGIGATGIQRSNIVIDETHVTDSEGYKKILSGSASKLRGKHGYRAEFEAQQRKIELYTPELNDPNPDNRAFAQRMIDKAKSDHAATVRAQRISGEASTSAQNSFAVRNNDNFSVGYLDLIDHRVRLFEGELPPDLPESPEAAAEMLRHFSKVYHRRAPTEIPTTPGYCTAHGFLDEPANQARHGNDELNIPFRSLKHPNLIFFLIIKPAYANAPRDAMQLDNPNQITMDDLKGKNALAILMAQAGIKKTYGPKPVELAGQRGRILGREYKHKGYLVPGGEGAAYELEAEVMGDPADPTRPHIKLQLAGALPDPDKLPPGQEAQRPALQGKQPPSFDEARKLFEQVVKSMRLRPVTGPALR